MSNDNAIIASAPARLPILGNAADWIPGFGVTINVAVEGESQPPNFRAWARVTKRDIPCNSIKVGGVTHGELEKGEIPPTFSPVHPFARMLGSFEAEGVAVSAATTIPPKSGMGGSTALLVALAYALNTYYKKGLGLSEIAELAQIADLLPGQVQGYQDPYAAAYGGVNIFYFINKRRGIKMTGEGNLGEEPCASVYSLNNIWKQLGIEIIVAIPRGLDRISGEVNALVAKKYLEGDCAVCAQMSKKIELAIAGRVLLSEGAIDGIWQAISEDLAIMDHWGWVSENHRVIIDEAINHGGHPTICGAAGAVAVYCPKGNADLIAKTLEPISERVHKVHVADGVRLEQPWPFANQ